MDSFFFRNLKRSYPVIESGSGVWLRDRDGRQYLDGCSGAVVSNIGHAVAEIKEAINAQLESIAFAHTSQFVSEAALQLSEKLIEIAPSSFNPGGRVYFVSGGSEAIETAIKMARAYFVELGMLKKSLLVTRHSSYHGSTIGALSLTGHPARRKPYLPLLPNSPKISASYPYRCACGTQGTCNSSDCGLRLANELEETILRHGSENVMAFVAEPVVGAALGAVPPHPSYFKRVREICDSHEVLFIADEVMTGLSRTGPVFALSDDGVQADIIALGKGLSAGYMPLGATLASAKVASAFENGSGVFEHGFTYNAHPVSCATGLAVLNYMHQHGLFKRVDAISEQFFSGLQKIANKYSCVNLRGRGLLAGMEFVSDPAEKTPFLSTLSFSKKLADLAAQNGLLIYPGAGSVDGVSGDHVIIAPPFTISKSEMDELFENLDRAVHAALESVKSVPAG